MTPRALWALLTLLAVATAVVVVAVVVVLWSVWREVTRPPAIAYSQLYYPAEASTVCAGSDLVYTNTLTVSRPALITFTPSWYSVDLDRFVGPASVPESRPFPRATSITARRTKQVPPDLPPGNYEYWFAAGNSDQAAGHIVAFTVKPCIP